MQKKQGISLIVLVITIIVMIILAASVVVSLSNTGIINKANEAVDKTNKQQVENLVQLIWAEAYADGKRGDELAYVVESKLEEIGITGTDYTVDVSDSGVSVDKFETADWEFAYVYDQTTSSWSSKKLAAEEPNVSGDIVAKFYNLGKTITPPSISFNGTDYTFVAGDSYKMVITGSGEMGNLMTVDADYNITGASAWQLDTVMFMQGAATTCLIPYVTEAIVLGDITNLGTHTFCGASSLKNLTLTDNIENIGSWSFMFCKSLTSLPIPAQLNSVGIDIMANSDSLKTVTVASKEEWDNMLVPRETSNYEFTDVNVIYKYRTKVERLANEGFEKALEAGKKTASALSEAVNTYLTSNGITSAKLELYNIETTTSGVTITSKTSTLGDVVLNGADYGKTVNYSVNGINNWKVLYEQIVNGNEYVYLIAGDTLTKSQVPTTITNSGAIIDAEGDIYWEWQKLTTAGTVTNKDIWMANWSDYSTDYNEKAVSHFLDESNWTSLKSTTYGSNVVGAIGTPTAEMLVASYNARSQALGDTLTNSTLTLSAETYGYKINGEYWLDLSRIDKLYTPSYESGRHTWLASPSDINAYSLLFLYYIASVGDIGYYYTILGVRPVVCLKSSIPASVGLTADSADIILK